MPFVIFALAAVPVDFSANWYLVRAACVLFFVEEFEYLWKLAQVQAV